MTSAMPTRVEVVTPPSSMPLPTGSRTVPPKTTAASGHACGWKGMTGSNTAAETKSFAKQLGLKPVTTPVTSLQSNVLAESFVKTLRLD